MKRGRPSTPAALKVLTGNPGKRPIQREPKPLGDGPVAPKTLTKNAQAIWKRTVAAQAPGVFTQVDENGLAAYCEAVAMHRTAIAMIDAHGMTTTGSTGQQTVSPWVKIVAEQARLTLSYQSRLGFDPASRAGLNLAEKTPDEDDGVE